MTLLLHLLIIIPVIGFVLSVLIPAKEETMISRVTFLSVGANLVVATVFMIIWILNDSPVLDVKDITLYKTPGYEYFLDFSFDTISAVYVFVGSFLVFLVNIYSRYYLHRESGYKRFFNTIMFFYMGYNVVVLAGNLETLFIGWEILGIASFLLIAFYRERYLPVKNAIKVFSIYRMGDVGIILAMWLSHHLWHQNITFRQLNDYTFVAAELQQHSLIGVFISLMILISAAAKSAQLPFSSWLPRAMEGPTPSSAIFYGSLSVHLGVFLLLRTFPFWEHQFSVRILIGVLGLATTLVTTGIARVQSSVKSQIAYASTAQIGLIFIEVAAGFETLALIHFAGNAFLRTYQLLVSPSVVSYLIREQFYDFSPHQKTIEDSYPRKVENSLYIWCLKEFNLDSFLYRYQWNPLKVLGKKLDFITLSRAITVFIPLYVIGLILLYFQDDIPPITSEIFPVALAALGLLMVLKAFAERQHARLSWSLIIMNHFWIALSVSFNEHFTFEHVMIYLVGVVIAGGLGYACLRRLKSLEGNIDLDRFHGFSYEHPKIAFVFLLACLGLSGFPITPAFIGEDLIFSHIHEDQALLAFLVSLSFVIDGLAIIRIYGRVFLGPHVKSVYEMAYRSS